MQTLQPMQGNSPYITDGGGPRSRGSGGQPPYPTAPQRCQPATAAATAAPDGQLHPYWLRPPWEMGQQPATGTAPQHPPPQQQGHTNQAPNTQRGTPQPPPTDQPTDDATAVPELTEDPSGTGGATRGSGGSAIRPLSRWHTNSVTGSNKRGKTGATWDEEEEWARVLARGPRPRRQTAAPPTECGLMGAHQRPAATRSRGTHATATARKPASSTCHRRTKRRKTNRPTAAAAAPNHAAAPNSGRTSRPSRPQAPQHRRDSSSNSAHRTGPCRGPPTSSASTRQGGELHHRPA